MTKTATRRPRLRSPKAAGYCKTCGNYRWHWLGCPEVDRDHLGREVKP